MGDITFLEVHLDDASITANAPFSGSDGTDSGEESEDDDQRQVPGIKTLVALAGLAGLIVVLYRLLGDDEE